MPDLDYARERFSAGMMILATHPGRVNERLYHAYEDAIRHARRIDDILDLELALDIEVFHRWMTEQTRAGNRGSTILAMSEDEASEAAKELFGLESRIRVEQQAQRSGGQRAGGGSSAGGPGAGPLKAGPVSNLDGGGRVGRSTSTQPLAPADRGVEDAPAGGTRPGGRPSPTSIDLRDADERGSVRFSRSD
jgi:hypothetical protein